MMRASERERQAEAKRRADVEYEHAQVQRRIATYHAEMEENARRLHELALERQERDRENNNFAWNKKN